MSITDELREYAHDCCAMVDDAIHDIADRIDAEHERLMQEQPYTIDMVPMTDEHMAEHGWVRLPKDADGEYIHVGDVMEYGRAHGRVIALMLSNYPKKWGGGLHWGIQLEGEQAPTALNLMFHHYHAPTVEDVLTEFFEEVGDGLHTLEAIDTQVIIAKYAKRLMLAEVEDA